MDLVYRDGRGKHVPVVYEGASTDGMTHTIRLADGSKLPVHDSNLQLLDQPDFQIFQRHLLNTEMKWG